MEEAIQVVNKRPKPLSLYLFTRTKELVERVLQKTSAGSVCVNDALMQILIETLPFGGVGESGMGKYHGKSTFETFGHCKSVMWKGQGREWTNRLFRYPPTTPSKQFYLDWLLFGGPQ